MSNVVLSVDVGTSSTKGVLVDVDDTSGAILATAVREHAVDRPHPGWAEMDAHIWWTEFVAIARELQAAAGGFGAVVRSVGVSGMGPCVLLTDEQNEPLRPAILYGVDTRATAQIDALNARWGSGAILERCGSELSSQAAGPKILWIAENEPSVMSRARRLYMPSSWLVAKLTGSYVLDQHSASQCTPMFDAAEESWYEPWAAAVAHGVELPELRWPGDIGGRITAHAAHETGLPAGIPVISGTIDAWAEALSVDAHNPGDLMLMYGTTMFLINTVDADRPVTHPSLWGTVGALPGTRNLAGGLATSGAITAWFRDLLSGDDVDFGSLTEAARQSPPGANGLLLLPYFAGERTPILDPDARGVLAGLTLSHTRGDIYRAILEATGFAVRHNLETFRRAGGRIERIVAVGGGAQGDLWTQIVSDITGCAQLVPRRTIGAAYGGAYLAARTIGLGDIAEWNPPVAIRRPNPVTADHYDSLYDLYGRLQEGTREIQHVLADLQHGG